MNLVNLIDAHLLEDEKTNKLYENSPFKTVRNLPTGTKGKRFEQITHNILTKMGYKVELANTPVFDRYVDGDRVEFKGSTLNARGVFNFLQLRLDDDFDYVILSTFWPLDLRLFKIKKEDIIKSSLLNSDQGGNRLNTNIVRLTGNPEDCEYCTEITAKAKPAKGSLV